MKLVSRVGQNILLALARYEEYWSGMKKVEIYGGQGLRGYQLFIKHGILLMITYFGPYLKQLERSALLIGSAV